MKKEKVFIDLSKLSEEQQKHIFSLLPDPRTPYLLEIDDDCYILCYKYNAPYGYEWIVCVNSFTYGKTELLYPEFIKLFEGWEGENNGWIKIESEKDLPKENELFYWTITERNKVPRQRYFYNFWNEYKDDGGKVTHYQPIVKPEPPKF